MSGGVTHKALALPCFHFKFQFIGIISSTSKFSPLHKACICYVKDLIIIVNCTSSRKLNT